MIIPKMSVPTNLKNNQIRDSGSFQPIFDGYQDCLYTDAGALAVLMLNVSRACDNFCISFVRYN